VNERIRELYKQAGMKFYGSSGNSFDIREFNPEKLAELIVRECANFVSETATIETLLGDRLKEHFGVE
jgi:hypothetical protein